MTSKRTFRNNSDDFERLLSPLNDGDHRQKYGWSMMQRNMTNFKLNTNYIDNVTLSSKTLLKCCIHYSLKQSDFFFIKYHARYCDFIAGISLLLRCGKVSSAKSNSMTVPINNRGLSIYVLCKSSSCPGLVWPINPYKLGLSMTIPSRWVTHSPTLG